MALAFAEVEVNGDEERFVGVVLVVAARSLGSISWRDDMAADIEFLESECLLFRELGSVVYVRCRWRLAPCAGSSMIKGRGGCHGVLLTDIDISWSVG